MEFNFDKSKDFYPYAINYIISLYGLVELFSRYGYGKIINAKNKGIDLDTVIRQQDATTPVLIDYVKEIYNRNLIPTILPGKFSLRSEKNNNSTPISIDNITLEFVDNHPYLLPFQIKAAGSLLVMAHHISKHKDDRGELWNFFYHCRNAGAHGGQFNITNPRFPAKWGNLEITMNMNGSNLFNDGSTPGLLGFADPLLLLLDIENIYM
jgi:hypothetical protein